MKNISLKMKILSGMLCAGLAFSGTNISFAAVKESDNTEIKSVTSINSKAPMEEKKIEDPAREKMRVTFKATIKECVESNIITRAEGDKVLKYVTEKVEKNCGDNGDCKKERDNYKKGGLFNELVTEGILTKEKADAVREKMHTKKIKIKTEELKKGLTTLVENKVLTIEQRNKVEEAIMSTYAQRSEDYKKMVNMTEEEQKDHMKRMKDTEIDAMKILVENGTITKDQMKEVKKVLHHNHKHDHKHEHKHEHKDK